jgi:hypothetical protein
MHKNFYSLRTFPNLLMFCSSSTHQLSCTVNTVFSVRLLKAVRLPHTTTVGYFDRRKEHIDELQQSFLLCEERT